MRKMFKSPDIDSTRVKTKFLFLPKIINNELRWLEKAIYLQKYIIPDYGEYEEGIHWKNIKWLN